ncbi:MAG: hypothetical protein EP343_09630 [Deltaproteobacteria bacterium]|nr:MAG: hypothetical protein EP343_09630 [Deltaproteobacteria bacterium]
MIDDIQNERFQPVWCGWFLAVVSVLLGMGSAPVRAKSPYPEQSCLEKLHRNQFRGAVRCMAKLHRKTKRPSFLLSLALLHEKAGEFHAGQTPSESCYYLDKAVSLYRRYLREEQTIRSDQKTYIQSNLSRLVQRIGYAQLNIESWPGAAKVSLSSVSSGRKLQWDIRPPYRAKLCPGKYKLEARRKGFESALVEVKLQPRQRVLRKIKLKPIPRPPFPAWGWTLVGAGTVGLAGALVYFFAEDRRRALESKLGQDVNWKENRIAAERLSIGATSLFVGAGVGVAAALVVFFVQQNKKFANGGNSPQIRRSLRPERGPSPSSDPSTRVTLWPHPKPEGM